MKDLNNINDNELIYMLRQDPDNIKNIIFEKYSFIIDLNINKYKKAIKIFSVDIEELKADASLAFSNAIMEYNDTKDASLKTYLSLCTERQIRKTIRKYTTGKFQMFSDMLSLEFENNDGRNYIMDTLKAEQKFEPLYNLTDSEEYDELMSLIKENLSDFEYKVFIKFVNEKNYNKIAEEMDKTPKQIDNTIQRIKNKIKSLAK